jgi:hypothetical protein
MEAIEIPPEFVALRIAMAAVRDSRLGSSATQTHTWVSSRITSIDLPFLRVDQRAFYVANDFHLLGQAAEHIMLLTLDGHELGDANAFLRDQYRLAMLLHVVHDAQAVGFEFSGGDSFHGHLDMAMVRKL